jgi:redox-sensitive bicupin YhaK (pirin superfamily)
MTTTVIEGRPHDLGHGLTVLRSLPTHECRSVGPFVFLDHAGPVVMDAQAARAADVRPHPHIGLSTVSYLLSGAVRHRDNLGSDQVIQPGDVNWMTSGRGIVHSERFDTPGAFAGAGLELIQFWVALPEEDQEIAPTFTHYAAGDLPHTENSQVRLRLIAGDAFGLTSPVHTHSPTFYVHAELTTDARIEVPSGHAERGAYIVRGRLRDQVRGTDYPARKLLVFSAGDAVVLHALEPTTVMLFGGEPLGPRFMWWNFVSSSKDRIREAAADWKAGRMALPADDDKEFIPLPDRPI